MHSALTATLAFVRAVESFDVAKASDLLAADARHHEKPNRLYPQGQVRDRDQLIAGVERGRSLLSSQTYEVLDALEDGDRAALRMAWTGTLREPLGQLPAGYAMRAHVGFFTRVRDGKLIELINYDSYEPF